MGHQAELSAKRGKLYIPSTNRLLIQQPAMYIGESSRGLYDNTPLNEEGASGVMKTGHWFVDGGIFTHLEADAFVVRRTKAQAENGAHLVSVHRYIGGYHRGRLGELSADRDPGAIYLIDLSSRMEGVQRPATMQNIFFPKAALGYDPDQHPPLITFAPSHPLGRLIFSLFTKIYDGLLHSNEFDLDGFEQLVACLKLAMGADPNEGNLRQKARAAMYESICSYIERHVDDWELSVDAILKNFGVSRATLYRLFEPRGGVRQYISDRRLFRAILELSSGPLRRGDISAAAEKWGFSSDANFNRAVRREFGVTPGTLISTLDPTAEMFQSVDAPVDLHWKGEALRHRLSPMHLKQMFRPSH